MCSIGQLPATLGNDLAGEVIAVGSAVAGFKVGDRVIACSRINDMGSFAEVARVMRVAQVWRRARSTSPPPVPCHSQGKPRSRPCGTFSTFDPACMFLITAGAGGVSCLAIQLAKAWAPRVSTTASPRGDALVRAMGADHVIDYTTTDLCEPRPHIRCRVRSGGRRRAGRLLQGCPPPAAPSFRSPGCQHLRLRARRSAWGWDQDPVLARQPRLAPKGRCEWRVYHYYFLHPNSSDLSRSPPWSMREH
ncbi:MAG: alcohol dehydrogenase catalytic domain-containing protein [Sphingomonadales bacterium]|nr:alcohol dehydrogenase catalytic domain-containing protein [Sphingomonadales bacterium]